MRRSLCGTTSPMALSNILLSSLWDTSLLWALSSPYMDTATPVLRVLCRLCTSCVYKCPACNKDGARLTWREALLHTEMAISQTGWLPGKNISETTSASGMKATSSLRGPGIIREEHMPCPRSLTFGNTPSYWERRKSDSTHTAMKCRDKCKRLLAVTIYKNQGYFYAFWFEKERRLGHLDSSLVLSSFLFIDHQIDKAF